MSTIPYSRVPLARAARHSGLELFADSFGIGGDFTFAGALRPTNAPARLNVMSEFSASLIPDPGPRPTVAPLTAPIRSSDSVTFGPAGWTSQFSLAPGQVLYAQDIDRIFESTLYQSDTGGFSPAYWEINNAGILWSTTFPGLYHNGTRILAMDVAYFNNSGMVVLETVGDIEFGAGLQLFNGNTSILREFNNSGSIFVLNDTDNNSVLPGILGVNFATGFVTYSVFDPVISNSGLVAVRADGGQAIGFLIFNGGTFTNAATGQILVQGELALGVRMSNGTLDNHGTIQAAATRSDVGPAIGIFSEGALVTNHVGASVTAEIAIFGNGRVNNAGVLNGDVVADEFFFLTNSVSGIINGDVGLGTGASTFTNTGHVTGNVFGLGGDDIIDNSAGTIGGIVDLGLGADQYTGSGGADRVAGDSGADHIDGGAGNDLLLGGAGNDTLIGGAGNDGLYGESGNDLIMTLGGD